MDRGTIGLGHLFGEAGGNPVAAHELPHRGGAFDAAEQVVLVRSQHLRTSRMAVLTLVSPLRLLANRRFCRDPG
jgi:hypothetical protein